MPTTTLTLYTRANCHLCEVARVELAREFAREIAAGELTIDECDVDSDPRGYQRYSDLVPAVTSGDTLWAYWFVDVAQLRAALAQAGVIEASAADTSNSAVPVEQRERGPRRSWSLWRRRDYD